MPAINHQSKKRFRESNQPIKKNKCEKIFSEEISSVANKRPEFTKALEFCRESDTLLVTSLSRSADPYQTYGRI